MSSRKRAPLIHRSSSSCSTTESDIKAICKSVSLASDPDEINSLLSRLFRADLTDVQSDLIPSIFKLVLLKLPPPPPTSPDNHFLIQPLVVFLSTIPVIPNYCPKTYRSLVGLIRWLVRTHCHQPLPWPSPTPQLLFLEICCRDSLRNVAMDKVIPDLALDLSRLSSSPSDKCIEAALILTNTLSTHSDPLLELLSYIYKIPKNSSLIILEQYLKKLIHLTRAIEKSIIEENPNISWIVSILLLTRIRWIGAILDCVSKNSFFHEISEIARKIFCPKLKQDSDFPSPLTSDDQSVNRFTVSYWTHFILTTTPNLSITKKLVLSSNVLHYQKWANCCIDSNQAKKQPGLLALLIAEDPEKLAMSLLQSTGDFKNIFVVIKSIITVSCAFADIGYIPGQIWILQRAIEVFQTDKIIGSIVTDFFREKIRNIYSHSPTRIFDKRIEDMLGETSRDDPKSSDYIQPLHNHSLTYLRNLKLFIEDQYWYRIGESNGQVESDHRKRLINYMRSDRSIPDSMPPSTPCPLRISFTIVEGSKLQLEISQKKSVKYSKIICENFSWSTIVAPLIDRLDSLMVENKETVKSADDHGEFWRTRKNIDSRLESLLMDIEAVFFNSFPDAKDYVTNLIDNNGSTVIGLVLPTICLGLPIESIPCMRKGVFVRSIDCLVPWVCGDVKNSPLRMGYIVNPGSDCGGSEEAIVPLLNQAGWSGTSGSAAGCLTDDDFIARLSSVDLFLYSGHGGGEKHWSGSCIQRMRYSNGAGIAILMGCSSAKPYGDYVAPFCTPFHYLLGGYRLVAGTLWDVLGRELDRMTAHLVGQIGENNESIYSRAALVIGESRGEAKLKFLSSASIVMYGVGF